MDLTLLMSESGGPESVDVMGSVLERSSGFLSLVSQIGDVCVNNEICLSFLTVTFMGLGVRLLRKVIGAFGRGR